MVIYVSVSSKLAQPGSLRPLRTVLAIFTAIGSSAVKGFPGVETPGCSYYQKVSNILPIINPKFPLNIIPGKWDWVLMTIIRAARIRKCNPITNQNFKVWRPKTSAIIDITIHTRPNESPRRKQRGIMLVNIYFFAASGGELTPK